tara:strand:+ start:1042 stop:3072 length:2031 start_codon:yes stop_codon:yes gene_type:complete
MNEKFLKKEYLKKISQLQKFNLAYYDKSAPIVADSEYDKLKKDIINFEKKYDFLKSPDSPSLIVGFKPSKNFKKKRHKVQMLSLSNAFNKEDLINFEKRIINYLDKKNDFKIEYSAEPKIDGISASLIYKKGKFVTGLSRGDGKEGEDITENLKTINDIPKRILDKDFPEEIDIRGEVFIKNSDFKKLSNKFANPRNAASGSLRQKDPNETKKIPLKFIAYTFGFQRNLQINSQTEFLKNLNKWGFKINPFNKKIVSINDLLENYKSLEKKRNNLDFDIDGIVYKVNDFELQKRLGNVANAPRWAIAHKFSANSGVSKILNIEIQIGRTGALTPVAKIKPINIGGVVVSNATLHNEDEIKRKDIRVGDIATIERAGDVIPHITSIEIQRREKNSKKFIFPTKCPSCGSSTIKDFNLITKKNDAVRRCSSEGFECEKISKEKIKHFVSKEAFNIEGFGKKIVENFWNLRLIKFPQDVFKIDYNKIKNLDGWGNQSVANLKYSIDLSKKISLERFIYALGIRHIGLENAKLISKHLKNMKKFLELSKTNMINDLLNIDGIGETQIKSIKNFFTNKTNLNVVYELNEILSIEDSKEFEKNGPLREKTFMLTGKLKGISRAEAKSLIEQNSGSIISNVSKKLNYLIVGEKPTKKKVDIANEIGVKVLNQTDLFKMLNKGG